MDAAKIRTCVDIPADLYGKLHARAIDDGVSIRQLILKGIEGVLAPAEPAQPSVRPALRLIEFPSARAAMPAGAARRRAR
ncbi:MAG: hypothetical protein FJW40_06890 [Acidobacteria bacterium]|nr:hypothetical protein [Acidobacteriota bacterium]